jgi:ribosomal protein L11 methyltransferase
MREVVLRVPAAAVEDVLDRLLLLVPGGVREVTDGDSVQLKMRGELPPMTEIARSAGRWPHRLSEHELPDDWRQRQVLDYTPDVIGGRLVVRPDWAPPASAGMLEIVLGNVSAFGAGTHPTTRTCLELVLDLPPSGTFADLGCGTGVLAILAAKLGWAPVLALDVQSESIAVAGANSAANRVEVQARVADLSAEPPPAADAIVANVPQPVHERVAAALPAQVDVAIVSGFGPEGSAGVLASYAAAGLHAKRVLERHGWVVALLRRA